MKIITFITISFLILEASNILALYFFPDTTYANSVGVFKAWEKSKKDPEIYDFVKYLVNWVAGTKLIFIFLMIVILVLADERTLIFAVASLIVSVASFFWRLFPLIRKMDREGQIEPKNYSRTLGWMIAGLLIVFSASALYAFLK